MKLHILTSSEIWFRVKKKKKKPKQHYASGFKFLFCFPSASFNGGFPFFALSRSVFSSFKTPYKQKWWCQSCECRQQNFKHTYSDIYIYANHICTHLHKTCFFFSLLEFLASIVQGLFLFFIFSFSLWVPKISAKVNRYDRYLKFTNFLH